MIFDSKRKLDHWRGKYSREYVKWANETDERFRTLHVCFMRSSYLTSVEKDIYLTILSFTDYRTGETFVSDERLAIQSGKSKAAIQRTLKNLEDKEMIVRLSIPMKERYIVLLPYPDKLYEEIFDPATIIDTQK